MVKKRNRSLHSETAKISLIKARATIKKKFRELHNQRLSLDRRTNEEYKPIIEPLKKLVVTKKENENGTQQPKKEIKEEEFNFEPASVYKTAGKENNKKNVHFNKFQSEMPSIDGISVMPSDESDSDHSSFHSTKDSFEESIKSEISRGESPEFNYGLRYEDEQLLLGKSKVRVSNNNYVVDGKSFSITPGLTELLLRNNPDLEQYNNNDLKVYKQMLTHTSAHKHNFRKNAAVVRAPKNNKYKSVINKLFPMKNPPKTKPKHQLKSGGCIKKPQMDFKVVNKTKKINYTYWDDPNELVDRLQLLIASQSAGHTGHDNEIISIIEELREAKIIK